MKNITILITLTTLGGLAVLGSCAPSKPPKPTTPVVKEDFTKGVYEPFATDNIVPYTYDNDDAYYPLYYYE